ncbi:hypothetical protein QTP88_007191 [Uroleucon formosanum]
MTLLRTTATLPAGRFLWHCQAADTTSSNYLSSPRPSVLPLPQFGKNCAAKTALVIVMSIAR